MKILFFSDETFKRFSFLKSEGCVFSDESFKCFAFPKSEGVAFQTRHLSVLPSKKMICFQRKVGAYGGLLFD